MQNYIICNGEIMGCTQKFKCCFYLLIDLNVEVRSYGPRGTGSLRRGEGT
ncbi:MAG: hypothetical protein ACI8ZN_001307 [Bacteroidia bacterium]|jgi:hypothetical protein